MEYNNFESHLSGSLREHSIAVDTDALIRAIHAEKPKDRKFLIWFLAFLGIAAVGYGLWLVSKTNVSTITTKSVNTPAQVARATLKNNTTPITSSLNSPNHALSQTPVENLSPQEFFEQMPTITTQNIVPTNIAKTSNVNVSLNFDEKGEQLQNSYIINREKVNADNHFEKLIISEAGHVNTAVSSISTIRTAQTKGILIPALETSSLGYKYAVPRRKVECPDFSISKNKWNFSLVPEIGAYYPLKSLSTSESNELYNTRKDQEKSLEGLAASLYLRATPKKWPIFIQSGVSWHRHTEQMNLKYDYTLKDTIQGIISITVSQTGDTITTIWGDIIQDKRFYGQKKVHHSFRLVDIPVGAGIHKSLGEFKVGIDAGILFNISMSSNGRLYNGDTTFAAIDALPTEVFKKSLGIQYYAGIFASRSIGVGELYLNARMRFIPNDFTNSEALIRQRYQFTGLYLGYVINL